LRSVFELIEGADATPTTQAVAEVAELQKALYSLLARRKELQSRNLPALNEQLKQSSLPPLAPPDFASFAFLCCLLKDNTKTPFQTNSL
jgi:hypothetical protein